MSSFKEYIGGVIEDNLKYKKLIEDMIKLKGNDIRVHRCSEDGCQKIGVFYGPRYGSPLYYSILGTGWVGEEMYHNQNCFGISAASRRKMWCKEHYTTEDNRMLNVIYDANVNFNVKIQKAFCGKCVSLFKNEYPNTECKILE